MYGINFTHEIFSAPSASIIVIDNDGKEIRSTNYFESEYAKRGLVQISFNAGAARLLLPPRVDDQVREMATADYAIISRGNWHGVVRAEDGSLMLAQPRPDALEIMFEDHSIRPFVIQVSREQYDLMPARGDDGRTDLELLVYRAGLELALRLPARYRKVSNLPCRRRW